MGMGTTKLISWEWEWEWECEGIKTLHFLISSQRKRNQPVSGATSASPGTLADSDILDYHSTQAKKRRLFDFNDLCDPEDDQQQSRKELAEYINLNGNGSGRE